MLLVEAEALARKKRLRAGHRASTTRILGQVQPAITAESLDVSKISQLKRSLEDKLQTLSVLDQEILELTAEEAIEEEIIQTNEIRERVYAAQSKLNSASVPTRPRRASTTDPTGPPAREPSPEDPPPPPDPTTTRRTPEAKVKLPKISLPRFGGDPVKWTSFWDSYNSAIHVNPNLSEVDKFTFSS